MRLYLPEIDLYKYQYEYDDEFLDIPINMNTEDFKYIMSIIRTTKKVILPQTKRALVEIMNHYTTLIFGKDMITSIRKNKRINNKVVSYYSRVFNDELFNKHIALFKITLVRTNCVNTICPIIINRYYNTVV